MDQTVYENTVDVPMYRPVVARPKRTGKQSKPVYRGKRPHVHKKSRCISTDFDMACLCFSCCRGSLQLQYYWCTSVQYSYTSKAAVQLRQQCVCVFSSHPFWTSMDVPAGVTQEEGHTGFLIHLPSAVRALIFVARRIQPFLSLVDREVEFCVLTN